MVNPNPLEYLMPGGHDLNDPEGLARWIADNDQEDGGAVPRQGSVFDGQQASTEGGQASPSGGAQMPGQWGSFLSDPANRAFLINAGVQLMSGGWGGWGEQIGRALAAGFQGAHAAERAQQGLDPQGLPRERRVTGGPRTRTGGPRRSTGLNPEAQQLVQQEVTRLQQAQAFMANPALTEAEWLAQAQPGGLLHQVLGPGAEYGRRQEYLVEVQERAQRLFQLPRRSGTVTTQELLRLGQSQLPSDQAEFQILARQLLGNPGVGFRWRWNPQNGQIDREPLAGRGGPPGPGGGRFTASSLAGVDQARFTIGNLREFITSPDHWGMIARAPQQAFNTGPYARVIGSMRDAVMSYMHARSGAQTSVRELEHYLSTKMPQPGDSQATILYKLADLELALMLIARRQGEEVPTGQMLEAYNQVRRQSGLPNVELREFEVLLPRLLGGTGIPQSGVPPPAQPGAQAPTAPPAPPVAPVAPPVRPPVVPPNVPSQQELEALKKRYGLE